MKNTRAVLALLVPAVLSCASAARSGTIYGNFAPGFGYNPTEAWGTGFVAQEFVTPEGSPSPFGGFDIALGWLTGVNSAQVYLMTKVQGVPGAVIESWDFYNLPFDDGEEHAPQAANSVGEITLSAATDYFLVVGKPQASQVVWFWNSTGADNGPPDFYQFSGPSLTGPWFVTGGDAPQGAFLISTTPTVTPEPNALSLCVLGLLAAGIAHALRSRTRIQADGS